MDKSNLALSWILRLVLVAILGYSAYAKLSGQQDALYIFNKIGMEPSGRYGSAIVEILASLLLLVPKTVWYGAVLAFLSMGSALFFHATSLGVEVNGSAKMFFMAIGVFFISLVLIVVHLGDSPLVKKVK